MLLYLAFRNIIARKSSFVIILFIAFAIALLVVTNAVFDSTEHGVRETFISSFTGDIVIRPQGKSPLSLFGDETPVTGKLTELPSLSPYNEILSFLQSNPAVADIVPQVTGLSRLSSAGADAMCCMFGVPARKYLEMMTSVRIVEGEPWADGEKGIMLSRNYAERLDARIGDILQFAISEGFSSRIRAVPLTAVYEYAVDNPTLDRIVLTNPETVRAIMDMTDLLSADKIVLSEEVEDILSADDIDDLFSDAADMSGGVMTEEIVISEDEVAALRSSYENSTSWNFLICRVSEPRRMKRVIKELNRVFRERDWSVEAVGWRSSAGGNASYLYMLRLILNIGIVIILGAGFIVVNNTLVINILDRIREIGTMRAIGASKRYIAKECAAETMIMAVMAGVLGCVMGTVGSAVVSSLRITFSNSFLVQLFGGTVLHTAVSPSNLLSALALALLIGLVAWIYPLITALRVNTAQAMQGAR